MIEKFLTKEQVAEINRLCDMLILTNYASIGSRIKNVLSTADSSQERSSLTRSQFAELTKMNNREAALLKEISYDG